MDFQDQSFFEITDYASDFLVCPHCGWRGDDNDIIQSGSESFFADAPDCDVISECPDCRLDAGHLRTGMV